MAILNAGLIQKWRKTYSSKELNKCDRSTSIIGHSQTKLAHTTGAFIALCVGILATFCTLIIEITVNISRDIFKLSSDVIREHGYSYGVANKLATCFVLAKNSTKIKQANNKRQKRAGDGVTLALKRMGRVIRSPKQREPAAPQSGPRSNKNFKKEKTKIKQNPSDLHNWDRATVYNIESKTMPRASLLSTGDDHQPLGNMGLMLD